MSFVRGLRPEGREKVRVVRVIPSGPSGLILYRLKAFA